jgi:hypothetical protein
MMPMPPPRMQGPPPGMMPPGAMPPGMGPPGGMPPGAMPPGPGGPEGMPMMGGLPLPLILQALMQSEDPMALAEQSQPEQDQMGNSPLIQALLGMQQPGYAAGQGMMPGC